MDGRARVTTNSCSDDLGGDARRCSWGGELLFGRAEHREPGETGDQTALAVPRIGLRGAAGVGLPQPLSPAEAAQVRRIFALQGSGSTAEAVRETGRLQNNLLLGAILADRYLRGGSEWSGARRLARPVRRSAGGSAIRGLLERDSAGGGDCGGRSAGWRRSGQCDMLRQRAASSSCRTAMPRRLPPPGCRGPMPEALLSAAWPR